MKFRKALILTFTAITCSSCSLIDYINGIFKPTPNPPSPIEGERPIPENGEGYELINPADQKFTTRELYQRVDSDVLNSTGDAHILVVPVDLKDSGRTWSTEQLDKINKAFFGEASETSWQSVSSFYESSSYGNLHIKGEVAPVFTCSKTYDELMETVVLGQRRPDSPVISEWNSNNSYNTLRRQYDTDGNGHVDSVAFIYNAPISYDNGYWAWVYWRGEAANVNKPTVNAFMWASYDFLDGSDSNQKDNRIDSHTYIHEAGHLFGITDYYPMSNIVDSSGCLDMHSNNVGDESVYTKYLMGWTQPYYVKTDTEVTLKIRSSALYGDAIIINDEWNRTPFDEYIAIEFYTPEGMNKNDALHRYKNGYKMYTVPGVRMYHIDSRLVKYKYSKFSYVDMEDINLSSDYYYIGASNDPATFRLPSGANQDIRLVHLLDAKGRYYYSSQNSSNKIYGHADDDTLFKKGDSYTASRTFFPNSISFNAGNLVGYSIIIDEITAGYATIKIAKI